MKELVSALILSTLFGFAGYWLGMRHSRSLELVMGGAGGAVVMLIDHKQHQVYQYQYGGGFNPLQIQQGASAK